MNRVELLEKIAPALDIEARNIEHTTRTKLDVKPEMVTFRPGNGGRVLEVEHEALPSLAATAGITTTMLDKLRPETLNRVTNELLESRGRYGVLLKENKIVAFQKATEFHPLKTTKVLDHIERAIPQAEYHRALVLPDRSLSIEVVGERRQPVQVGDLVQAGALVTFSPLGIIEPMIQSYVLRQQCMNGQTSNVVANRYHFSRGSGGGEGDDIWQFFRRGIRAAYNSVDRIVNRYQAMIQHEVPAEERALVIAAMLKEAGIGGAEADAVRQRAIAHPPQNSYDVLNLLTWATSHVITKPERVVKAQQAIAGFIVESEHSKYCPTCRHER